MSQAVILRNKLDEIMKNPPTSDYDYFIKFEKDTLSFTEGVRAVIEAANVLWAVREIIEAQKKHSFGSTQAWVLSSVVLSGTPTLKGYNAETLNRKCFMEDKPFSTATPIFVKRLTTQTLPIKGEIRFWVSDGLIMLSAESVEIPASQAA